MPSRTSAHFLNQAGEKRVLGGDSRPRLSPERSAKAAANRQQPLFATLPSMSTLVEPVQVKRARLESVDVLRGVVMILMAIDHSRDFFGTPAVNPTNLDVTTVPLFFTRWITHICAPTFFLLTGTGAWLSRPRKSTPELSRFLLPRGLWLIFLEGVVTRCFGWQLNFDYHVTMLIVL